MLTNYLTDPMHLNSPTQFLNDGVGEALPASEITELLKEGAMGLSSVSARMAMNELIGESLKTISVRDTTIQAGNLVKCGQAKPPCVNL